MTKGEATRKTIVDHAMALAASIGLEGLTIGRLADDLKLSKSGLFAHFRSKESLQIQVLDAAALRFIEVVTRPAMKAPRGAARLRALFERWLIWSKGGDTAASPNGCVFFAAATEYDDQDGPVRDTLVRIQRELRELLVSIVRRGVEQGVYRAEGLDAEQFAHDFYGIMLSYHFHLRLLRDPSAEIRAYAAFERLLATITTSGDSGHTLVASMPH